MQTCITDYLHVASLFSLIIFVQASSDNPGTVGQARTKHLACTQMACISAQRNATKKAEKRTEYGMRETPNPLFDLSVDLFR